MTRCRLLPQTESFEELAIFESSVRGSLSTYDSIYKVVFAGNMMQFYRNHKWIYFAHGLFNSESCRFIHETFLSRARVINSIFYLPQSHEYD